MRLQPIEQKIADIVRPAIEDLGFSLFLVKLNGEAGSKTLQIMAEDPATRRLGVDDCAVISRAVSALMDVEDPISGAYRLEVSSPGIDRLLIRLEDFEAYKGFEAKVETDRPAAENGQKRFRGVVNGVKENHVLLQTDTGEVEIPYDSVHKAKLVLNDALIKATANLQEPKS